MDVNEELKVCENSKKKKIEGGGWVRGGRVGGGGVRVDVNAEFKFLGKFTKKLGGGGVGRRGVRWGSGWWGSGWM